MSDNTKKELQTQLWNIANTLRGKMGADEFRDYILGFIFYKYLSERMHLFADEILKHDGIKFDEGFRADLIVAGLVIIELKSVEDIHPVHKKQLLTYLRLADKRLGYLINFGAELIKDGISRVSNGAADWKTG